MNEDGSVVIGVNMDVAKAEKDLAKLRANIEKLRQEIETKTARRSQLEEESAALGARLDEAKIKLEEMRSAGRGVFSREDVASQREEVSLLAKEYNKVTTELETINGRLPQAEAELAASQDEAVELHTAMSEASASTQDLAENTEEASQGAKHATTAFEKFERRIAGLVKRVFIFSVITAALRKLRTWLSGVVTGNDEASAAVAKLKASLLTLAQPIVNVIIPVFTRFIQILTAVINKIIGFVAAVTGKDATVWAQQAKDLNDEKDAIKGVGGAAKEASKYLAGFDELNTMNDTSGGGGGGDTAGGADFSDLLGGNPGEGVEEELIKIGTVSGLAMLGLGLLLAFSGVNIPLGLGMMAAGALALGIASGGDPEELKNTVTGLIKEYADDILAISLAFLVLGILIAFSGLNIGLGIGMIVIGAAGLAAELGLNGEDAKAKIVKALKENAGAIIAISMFFLVVGIILLFVPGSLPLGIGMIAAGAAGLYKSINPDWNAIKDKVVTVFRENGKAIAALSAALLVIGILLCFVPGMLPLGIGLLVAGAGAMFTVAALNWDAILDKLKEVWQSISSWFRENVAPKFTKEYWQEKFASISEGLKSKIKDGINAAIELFNQFVDWINQKLNIKWDAVSILGQEIIPSGNFQLVRLNRIPKLAQGAVIPPNREFMAVLGDQTHGNNIEAPEELIRKIVREEGGGSTEVVSLMREMLEYLAAGQVIELDNREFGRATTRAVKSAMRTGALEM